MPALVNSSVGSPSGTTGEDGTKVWPCFCTKKSMNCWRISLAVGITEKTHLRKGSSRVRRLLRKRLLGGGIDLAEGDAVLPGDAGAVFVLGREERGLAVAPAELALHRAPGRLDRAGPAFELVPAGERPADAEGGRLAKEDLFHGRQ